MCIRDRNCTVGDAVYQVDGEFAAETIYTAKITLTAKAGYTLTGVAKDFFTVAGATCSNDANSGVITAVFPKTSVVQGLELGVSPAELRIGGTINAEIAGADKDLSLIHISYKEVK